MDAYNTMLPLFVGCSTKEVRDRFKKLALKWHPDKNIDNPDEAQKVANYIYTAICPATVFSCRNSKRYLQHTLNWYLRTVRRRMMIFPT